LLVTEAGGERVGLRVDRFAERIDTLVRPRSGMLAVARGVSGSTLLGDGSVLLVLDLAELVA
jgi:two-component system chemotaxis sensor kinase CheA